MSNSDAPRTTESDVALDLRLLRVLSCDLEFEVNRDSAIELQIAVAKSAAVVVGETLAVTVDGEAVRSIREIEGPHGARIHYVHVPSGRLDVVYRAELRVTTPPAVIRIKASDESGAGAKPDIEYPELMYLRPSRYCQSDHLEGFALTEFGTTAAASDRVDAVVEWIRRRIDYLPGSGSVHDSAEDTLLTGLGTCRDFAHLGVALCRAIGIASRFTAVYAPGLTPMDFHAVFETLQGGRWLVHDATGLAPRSGFVRISTGRDAADAAFASFEREAVTLTRMNVGASTGSVLPLEDWSQAVELA